MASDFSLQAGAMMSTEDSGLVDILCCFKEKRKIQHKADT
jgi:hypothetical protein